VVEPFGGLVGTAAVGFSATLLPWGLAFAAGAMPFVISGEIIPETHRGGKEHCATLSLVAGFVLMMMILDRRSAEVERGRFGFHTVLGNPMDLVGDHREVLIQALLDEGHGEGG